MCSIPSDFRIQRESRRLFPGCATQTYSIIHIPLTPASAYTANGYSNVWSQIGAGHLDNSIASGCRDNGAALEWQGITLAPDQNMVIESAISFGDIPVIAQFRVDSVSPNRGERGQTLNVQVAGIGFEADTTFGFGSGINVTSIAINSQTNATVDLTIDNSAALGYRDVTGEQTPGGLMDTLVDGFEVVALTPPPPTTPAAIPTLSGWMLIMLVAFVVLLAFSRMTNNRT